MKKNKEEISFRDLINLFLPKLWIIAVVAIAFGTVSCVKSCFFTQDTYTASSRYYFWDEDKQAVMNEKKPEEMVEICQLVVKSDELLAEVIEALPNSRISTSYLKSVISFKNLDNGFLMINVKTTNADLSWEIAKAIEDTLPEIYYSQIPDHLQIRTHQSATKPTAPDTVPVVKNTLVAFLAGAVISTAVIWVISVFDVVIHDKKKIEDSFDIPILGVIPRQEVK